MSIRKIFENSQGAVISGAVLVLFIASLLIYRGIQGGRPQVLVPRWAYDLNTKEILVANSDQLAPFDTGSGTFAYPGMQTRGAGVDAHIYTCGNPADIQAGMTVEDLAAVDARLVFVTRYPDAVADALQLSDSDAEPTGAIDPEVRLLSDLEGQNWVPHMSGPAFALREKVLGRCGSGEYPVQVEP